MAGKVTSKVWLVTGCSTGLGRELVKEILRRGDEAIATARTISALKDLSEDGAATIELDVTATDEILKQKVKEAIGIYGHIDAVVHNAGSFQMGSWEDLNQDLVQRQFQTNVFGPMNLTRALLPHLRERKDGTLVFMGSTSAWMTFAGAGAYGASKAALGRAVDGLAREVGPFGIKVLSIDAGAFGSRLLRNAANARPPSEHYQWLMDAVDQSFEWLEKNALGDITKLSNLIIDVVKSEGVAKGKEISPRFPKPPHQVFEEWSNAPPNQIPLTLPAGSDAMEVIKARCNGMLRLIDQWEGTVKSTDAER